MLKVKDILFKIASFLSGRANFILGFLFFLIALNYASQYLYLRLDTSEGKIYSLSRASKRIVKALEDPVIVKGYFTKDLPQPYSSYRDYLSDLLRAYKSYGGKNFEYKFVDYPKDEDFKKEALQMGVAPVRLTYIAKDKYEIKDGFMGLVLLHEDKKETIPVMRDVMGLEYDLTGRIKRLTTKEPSVVGLVKGKASRELPPQILASIRDTYETKDIDLSQKLDLSDLPKSLLVVGPREAFGDVELARLEQIILRGVPAAFFLDTKNIDIESGSFFAKNIDTGIDRLLNNWGLSLQRNLVLDIQNQPISIQQQAGMFLINNIVSYPLMPVVTNLSKASPVTRELDQMVIPFASPITVATETVKGLNLEVLARTTKLSWTKANLWSFSPLADFEPDPKDPKGPFDLAISLEGKFPVLFKEPPTEIANSTSDAMATQWLKESNLTSRILLCSTSLIIDTRIPGSSSNQVFFLNTVDWLAQDSDLVVIRSKGAKLRPFSVQPGYALKQIIKFLSMFLMPLLVSFWGLWRWQQRKHWKAKVRDQILTAEAAA